MVWSRKGEYEKAIVDFTEAVRFDDLSAQAFLGRGTAWNHKKKYAKAMADYVESLALDSTNADAYIAKAGTFSQTVVCHLNGADSLRGKAGVIR